MPKEKACAVCKAIFTEGNCPICSSSEAGNTIKGKVCIFNTEKSQIASNMKINKPGEYAIKIR